MLTNHSSPLVAITGASSGIGAALALEYATLGFRVALLARRKDKLIELANKINSGGGKAIVLECDVTKAESVKAAFSQIILELGNVDVVIANAGFAVAGSVSKLSNQDYDRQFQTNIFGVLNTFREARESLIATKGIFAVIGSIASHMPLPFATPYSMSKAAIRSFSLALRLEMQHHAVSVVLVSPGYVATDIANVDNHGVLQEKKSKQLPSKLAMPANTAARLIRKGIQARKREVVITQHGKWLVRFHQWFPGISEKLFFKMMT